MPPTNDPIAALTAAAEAIQKAAEQQLKIAEEQRRLNLLPRPDQNAARRQGSGGGSLFSASGLQQTVQGIPGVGAASGVMGAAGGALTAFAGVAGAAVSSISSLTNAVSTFVNAISPSTMQMLGRAFHDLNAAIGQAFTGAIEVAVEYVRELGAIINPLAQTFAPIITQLATVMKDLAVPYVELFASVLESIAPILQLFADGLKAITPVIQAVIYILNALFKTLVQWIGSFFDSGATRSAMDAFQRGLREMAKAMIYTAASIAQYFGATGVLRSLLSTLNGGRRQDATGLGVASNPQQQDVMSYARQSMLEALVATGAGSTRQTEEDWRDEVKVILRNVLNGQENAIEIALDNSMEKIQKAMTKAVQAAIGMGDGESVSTWAARWWANNLTAPGALVSAFRR